MNRVLLIVLLVIFTKVLPAQDYITQGVSPDLYLTHQVAAKETWYGIARKYNLTPTQLAVFNQVSLQTPLEVGRTLKVPLTASNFTQNESKSADETLQPVYHVVQEKEWMYRISVNHNKVPIERLEKWNSIKRDQARAGMKLIVGHLRVKSGADVAANNTQTPAATTQKQSQTTPQPQAQQNTTTTTPTAATSGGTAAGQGNEGFFRSQFAGGGKNQSGVAGIFKSTSGWNDGKYYALMNNVTVGTIIRITFPQTNKSVYAKVLGELPEMKESAGLALRISDAAAGELGATAGKFSVQVTY